MISKDWFASWFDSPFYHKLYRHRDEHEAKTFMDNLIDFLALPEGSTILDLACGRGRHSIYLNSKGYDVTGVDLSRQSIKFAKKFENQHLKFIRHDMREICHNAHFDAVLNMFTSFGYFATQEEDLKVVKSARCNLKTGGRLVIDFLNSYRVRKEMVETDIRTIESEGVMFRTAKKLDGDFIVKNIDFDYDGEHYHFEERVRALHLEDFSGYFAKANLKQVALFGDYALNPFQEEESERMIFVVEKS